MNHFGSKMKKPAPKLDAGHKVRRPAAREGKISSSRAQLAMLMEGIDWRILKKTWRPIMVG
jgi:hypothetical protein